MKYYLDTEFHEYQRKFWFHKPARTIELISIGIVAEDGREYYAISKDFDLKAAWNSWQPKTEMRDTGMRKVEVKEYWLRDNVLKPIFDELKKKIYVWVEGFEFNYSNMKYLVDKFGKSNSQIAEEVKEFVYRSNDNIHPDTVLNFNEMIKIRPIEFYAYYADYDWVVFCWLFGKMIDLPKGFPMYCRDLKQILDEKVLSLCGGNVNEVGRFLENTEAQLDYPQQSNEHNALSDAKWDKELHNFINKL